MKRIFNTNYNHDSLDFGLFLLRVVAACFMMSHGYAKLTTALTGAEIQFADPIGVGVALSFYLAIFAEFFCSILLLLGLATRLALLPLIVTMAVVVFLVHFHEGFQKMELPAMYLVTYVFLLFSGPGKYSIDSVISKNANRRRTF
ncbi:DoxX family protein [Pedobacter sp.]|uniref:DoxX family protein n=1 Tax=Pedobacter sp. TaxID=1411316 RepID=UPI003D7FCA94